MQACDQKSQAFLLGFTKKPPIRWVHKYQPGHILLYQCSLSLKRNNNEKSPSDFLRL